ERLAGAPILAMVLAAVLAAAGCSDSSPSSPTKIITVQTATDVTAFISDNHGHVAVLTGAQIMAGAAVTLDIQGQALHTHTVTLTATQVGQIGAKQQVTVTSSPASVGVSHTHQVTFN